MTRTLRLVDAQSVDGLQAFLASAARVEDGTVRLIVDSGVLAAYVAVLHPTGLLDETPTVLGLRTFVIEGRESFDVVVPQRSLAQRLAHARPATSDALPVAVGLPMEVNSMTWTGINPPREGWCSTGTVAGDAIERAARTGVDEVAATLPDSADGALLRRLRADVWGRQVPELGDAVAGVAFAALVLGLLDRDPSGGAVLYESGPWTRLTTAQGHVLFKRPAWTLQR